MTRLRQVPEPSIIVPLPTTTEPTVRKRLTFTGAIGAACMLPLRGIINLCVAWRIHPNTLTLIGVLINVGAAWALGYGRFRLAFVIMLVANIFDFIDGKVAHILGLQSEFGAFWDSTLDRFSDLALLTGLIFLYSKLNRSDYVMIGTITNRMAGVLWVVLVLSILAVANRIYYTYLALNRLPMPSKEGAVGVFNRAFFWTDERATLPYDLWVIAILAFVWLIPPQWLGDPMAHDAGLIAWIVQAIRN